MAALDRLGVREISGRFLSQDERIEIADLRHAGLSIRQVAARIHIAHVPDLQIGARVRQRIAKQTTVIADSGLA